MKTLNDITKNDLEEFLIKFYKFDPECWTLPKIVKYEIDIDSRDEPTIYLTFTQTNFLDNKDMEVSGHLKFGEEPLTFFSWVTLGGNGRDSIDRFTLPKIKFWHNLGYDILNFKPELNECRETITNMHKQIFDMGESISHAIIEIESLYKRLGYSNSNVLRELKNSANIES